MKDKDIYDLLNEIDINEECIELEEIESNDIEKMKVLNSVKKKIKANKRGKKTRKGIAIASILILTIISTSIFYNIDDILASDIPIIKDIFKMFGYKKEFKENSNELNLYKENKNGSITINEILFDGRNIFLTYTIKTKEPIGYNLYVSSDIELLNNENKYLTMLGGSSAEKRVDDYTIIGTIKRSLSDKKNEYKMGKLANEIYINVLFNEVNYFKSNEENYKEGDEAYNSDNGEEKSIDMNLNFDIKLEALENINYSVSNKQIKDDKTNIEVYINSMSMSPVGVEIVYNWDIENVPDEYKGIKETRNVAIRLNLEDDLGNKYNASSLQENSTDESNLKTGVEMFDKIDENAKKLYIKPYYMVYSVNGEYVLNEDGTTEFIERKTDEKVQQLDEQEIGIIEIDLESLK